jgi:hypothetical protein
MKTQCGCRPIFIDVFIKFLRTRLFTGLKPWSFLTCCAQFPNTFKEDYREIVSGAQKGIGRMRKDVESFQQKN